MKVLAVKCLVRCERVERAEQERRELVQAHGANPSKYGPSIFDKYKKLQERIEFFHNQMDRVL